MTSKSSSSTTTSSSSSISSGNHEKKESRVITIHIFTDKNLLKILQQGWSEERLLKGQIATLTGRKFSIKIEHDAKIQDIKSKIEDKEGIPIEKQMQIRKGSKILQEDKNLSYYFIKDQDTLLLVVEYVDEFAYLRDNDEDDPKVKSVKQKFAPVITQTLTISEEEAAKMKDKKNSNWWESSYSLSGPVTPKKKNSSTPTSTSTQDTTTPFDEVLLDKSKDVENLAESADSSPIKDKAITDPNSYSGKENITISSSGSSGSSSSSTGTAIGSGGSGGRVLGGESSNSNEKDSSEKKRELLRKASESRLKKFQN